MVLPWFQSGLLEFNLSFQFDALSTLMFVLVLMVAIPIHVYSIGYMKKDKRIGTYFVYLIFFTLSMLGLITAANFFLLFIFWELVGLSSYLLIGHWFEKPAAAEAAKKAFLVTKLGDLGFLLSLFLIATTFGTFEFNEIFIKSSGETGLISTAVQVGLPAVQVGLPLLTLISLLIFAGAVGKSAQFPLLVWLPDAMEGPTPVSALIHAATMVAAGVYLVARTFPLFTADSLQVVLIIGTATAIIGAIIALTRFDIKKILAYSTISQLGYMMAALGAGSALAGIFHLTTHAFFKALLFLAAGSLIHTLHTQNLFELKGLASKMPVTFWSFLIGGLALSGLPPFSGFFSKEEILAATFVNHKIAFTFLILTSFLTTFYIFRLIFSVFWGKQTQRKITDPGKIMTIPLIILGALAFSAGFFEKIFGFLPGSTTHHFLVSTLGLAAPLLGLYLASRVYVRRDLRLTVTGIPFKLSWHQFYLDQIYGFLIVKPTNLFAKIFAWFDQKIIDFAVNLIAKITLVFAKISRFFDLKFIDRIVNGIGITSKFCAFYLRKLQTGNTQTYVFVFLTGVIFLLILTYL